MWIRYSDFRFNFTTWDELVHLSIHQREEGQQQGEQRQQERVIVKLSNRSKNLADMPNQVQGKPFPPKTNHST